MHTPKSIDGAEVENVESFNFFGENIINNLFSTNYIEAVAAKCTPMPFLSQKTKGVWHVHRGEHPIRMHHSWFCQQLCPRLHEITGICIRNLVHRTIQSPHTHPTNTTHTLQCWENSQQSQGPMHIIKHVLLDSGTVYSPPLSDY